MTVRGQAYRALCRHRDRMDSRSDFPLAERGKRKQAIAVVIAVAIGFLLVFSNFGFRFSSTSPSRNGSVANGPTFYQALASLNSSVMNQSGGPWSLVSVFGVASPTPFSPGVASFINLNISLNACQQQLAGVTMWNGSIPTFSGTFNSGTAPFWQMGYFSESSQEMLFATSVSGNPHIFDPMSVTSQCLDAYTSFRGDPSFWVNQIVANGTLPVDSSIAGRVAWNNLDQRWIDDNAPLAEVYALGPGMITGTGDVYGGNWEVYFMGCGVAGYTGVRPDYAVGVSRTGEWGGALNFTRNCVTLYNEGPVIDRGINKFFFENATVLSETTTAWVTTSFQLGVTALNGSLYDAYYDGWGVADWMTSLNLTGPSGQRLPLALSGCPNWVPMVSDCKANSSGWFVVLLSAGGEWLASYGATGPSAASWSVPVTAMVSHQSLVVVLPSAWSVSGDDLTVNSTASVCIINGTSTL